MTKITGKLLAAEERRLRKEEQPYRDMLRVMTQSKAAALSVITSIALIAEYPHGKERDHVFEEALTDILCKIWRR